MTAVLVPDGPDAGAIWHYGDPLREQRLLVGGQASVDLSHRPVFSVGGPDRAAWLREVANLGATRPLAPGVSAAQPMTATPTPPAPMTPPTHGLPSTGYATDDAGRIVCSFTGWDDGDTFWAHTEPGRLDALLAWLRAASGGAMVEVADRRTHVLVQRAGAGSPDIVPATDAPTALGEVHAGLWAYEALRIERREPRPFLDADAVDPTRDLVLLHLDGMDGDLPAVGAPVLSGGAVVGRMGTSAQHWRLGPIGLALVDRSLAPGAPLAVDGIAAAVAA